MGIFMPVGFVVAERLLYIPSMGFCLLLAHIIDPYFPPRPVLAPVTKEPSKKGKSTKEDNSDDVLSQPLNNAAIVVLILSSLLIGAYSLKYDVVFLL